MRLNNNKPGSRKHDELAFLDHISGVYIISNYPDREVYVGSTGDLRARLRAHAKRFAGWEVGWKQCPIEEARRREVTAIRVFVRKGFRILNTRLEQSTGRHPTVSRACFHNRLKMGWSPERARKTPVRGK